MEGTSLGEMLSAIRLARRSSSASTSATPLTFLVPSSTPSTMTPPEVFANATIAFRTPSGEERSRLNSSVLPSCRLRRVVFAEPPAAVGGPIVQVLLGPPGKRFLPQLLAQSVEVVGQARSQFGLRHGAHVGLNERLVEEADDHGRLVGHQQTPRGIGFPKLVKSAIIHEEAAGFHCSLGPLPDGRGSDGSPRDSNPSRDRQGAVCRCKLFEPGQLSPRIPFKGTS